MKKLSLVVTASILFISCGSNAENNVSETRELVQQEELAIEEEVVEAIPVEENIEENKTAEEIIEPVVEEKVVAEEKTRKDKVKKEVVKKVKEIIPEIIEEEKPVIVEVVRAKHEVWDNLSKKNVTAAGKVNYKGMKTDISKIKSYLLHLEKISPIADWSRNEKLAYWINLYNASTVYLVVNNYPIKSITKINGGKPWDKKFVKSGDKVYSLNQIEHEIIRPRFKDPRIHAALNCAAVSCPKMLNAAFLPASLSKQLDMQCYAWINDGSRNEVDPNKLVISQIFDWYGEDFKAGGGVIKFIGKYNRTKIMINPKAAISYKEYNWDLNE